jgi:excisionase family DNA binding protein
MAETLTKEEAAAHIGVSVRTLQRIVGKGELPVSYERGKKGDEARFQLSDLNAYLERNKSHALMRQAAPDVASPVTPDALNQFAEILTAHITATQGELIERLAGAQERFLTRREAAEEFGLSVSTVERAIKAKELSVYACGPRGSHVLRRSEVLRFVSTLKPVDGAP